MDTSKSPETGPETKPQEPAALAKLAETMKPLADTIARGIALAGWQSTIQTVLVVVGGLGVLGLAYLAALRGEWPTAEKIGIPVLSFFAGVFAGRRAS